MRLEIFRVSEAGKSSNALNRCAIRVCLRAMLCTRRLSQEDEKETIGRWYRRYVGISSREVFC